MFKRLPALFGGDGGLVAELVAGLSPLQGELAGGDFCWLYELHVVNVYLFGDEVGLLQASRTVVVDEPVDHSELAGTEAQLGTKTHPLVGSQVDTLRLLQHEHLCAGGELQLDVEQVGLGGVDQQDVEEQVVLAHPHKRLGVKRVEAAS